MILKSKSNTNIPGRDHCQTPPYALDPLLPYIPKWWKIWESAAGEGYLTAELTKRGYETWATDLENGERYDFLKNEELPHSCIWDCSITNPPFSKKYPWYKRCYEIGKPFALLMQIDVFGAVTAHKLWKEYGTTVILLDKRIDFKMPNKGWQGEGAHFSVAWFTWGIPALDSLKSPIVFGEISQERKDDWKAKMKGE